MNKDLEFNDLDNMIDHYIKKTGDSPKELLINKIGWKILEKSIPEDKIKEVTDHPLVQDEMGIKFDDKDWITKMVYRGLNILVEM